MLRKLISLGPRGCQAAGSNFRTCQVASQVSQCQNFETSSNAASTEVQANALICSKRHQTQCQNELKYAESLINTLITGAKVSPENRIKSILEFCNGKGDETYKHDIGDKIYMWCTSVLTVSSLLLCQSWLSNEPEKRRSPTWLNPETIQNVIKNYFWGIPRDHLLLSVKATPSDEASADVGGSGNLLDFTTDKLKTTSEECTASILNKLALQLVSAGQPKQAVQLFEIAAENGHTSAIFNMGLCFDHGKGVQQNQVKASKYYEQAAKKGHAKAQFNLAMLYAEGPEGLRKDSKKALELLELSAENGNTRAQVLLGFHFEKRGNQVKAAKCFQMASRAKDPVAMYHLGICLENGIGIRKNIEKAGHLYEEAAERGHVSAMYNVAIFYEKGFAGFPKSPDKAMYWYQKGAENGDNEAEAKLEELRHPKTTNSYKMHPILRDIFMWNLLNTPEQKAEIHKSRSTPDLQRNCQKTHPEVRNIFPRQSHNYLQTYEQSELSSSQSCGIEIANRSSSGNLDLLI